jgi:hypothetical protein
MSIMASWQFHLAETEPTRDPSITPFFGFEAKDRAVALGGFLWVGKNWRAAFPRFAPELSVLLL